MLPRVSATARALRRAAMVWTLLGVASVGVSFGHVWLVSHHLERGGSFEEVQGYATALSMAALLLHTAGTIAIAVLAWTWVRRSEPRARLALGGWILLLAHLFASLGHRAMLAMATEIADYELLETMHLVQTGLMYGGLVFLLASTRGPAWRSIVFGLAAFGWYAFLFAMQGREWPAGVPQWLWVPIVMGLALGWSAAIWCAAPRYADDPEEPAPLESLDAERRTAASGIALVRAGLTARIVIAFFGVVVLAALRESGGGIVWLVAFASVAATVVIGAGLSRYGALPSVAQERGLVTAVIACLVIGAMFDLYGAYAMSQLLSWSARASSATSMWGMPSLSEAESIQRRAQWCARLASVVGISAAFVLTISLRTTARWLRDERAAGLASLIGIATLIVGSALVVGGVLLQTVRSRDVGLVVILGLFALGVGVWLLVSWYRLLGALHRGLLTAPASGDPLDDDSERIAAARRRRGRP